ncbi:MAG: RluA family pseudouridine synthase [Candidatus Krumholzibacteria bacterium]|nr:RluA family pseudouridine synthase [Candidatus Krumholzibacteria bacterium]
MTNTEKPRGRELRVGPEWDGSRLDRFVRAALPGLSFPAVQTMLRRRRILLNGGEAGPAVRLRTGDAVSLDIRAMPASGSVGGTSRAAPPRGMRGRVSGLRVLFEDADMLVVDKPAGLPVQPGNRKERGSLLDLLPPPAGCGGAPPFPPSPVHRLDTGTSGALVVAKTRQAARDLSKAFGGGGVKKTYLAVVEGVPHPPSATIDAPLGVRKGMRSRAVLSGAGRAAETAYRLIREREDGRALLEVVILTGRTHQIRAHLASIGHPVAGDIYYGSRAPRRHAWRRGDGASPPRRMLLHAWKIEFPHPRTGRPVRVASPPPREFGL